MKGPSEPTSHIYKTSCSRSNKPTHPPLHSPLTRSTQLGCQSSQAPPPNHENGVHCASSDSVSMLIMTTHSGLDSFLPFYTTEGKPVLIALPSAELNQTGISLICTTGHRPSETQTAFWPFMTLNYTRQSDLGSPLRP